MEYYRLKYQGVKNIRFNWVIKLSDTVFRVADNKGVLSDNYIYLFPSDILSLFPAQINKKYGTIEKIK